MRHKHVKDETIVILLMRMRGMSSTEIASAMNYSARTIETRFDAMRQKYEAKNIVHLIGILVSKGIITPADIRAYEIY